MRWQLDETKEWHRLTNLEALLAEVHEDQAALSKLATTPNLLGVVQRFEAVEGTLTLLESSLARGIEAQRLVSPRKSRATLRKFDIPYIVISKDDVIPKLSFFGIFTGNFWISRFLGILLDVSGSSQNSRSENFPVNMPKNENFGITSSFGITTNRG